MTEQAVAPQPSSARAGAVMTARALAAVVVLQIALAGLGAFSSLRVKDQDDALWGPHEIVGNVAALLAVVLVVVVVAARAGSRPIMLAVALLVLAGPVQPVLAGLGEDSSAWFGLLHALVGITIGGLAGWFSATLKR